MIVRSKIFFVMLFIISVFLYQNCGPGFKIESENLSSMDNLSSVEVDGFQKIEILDEKNTSKIIQELKDSGITQIQILPESKILIKADGDKILRLKQNLNGKVLFQPLVVYSQNINEDEDIKRKLIDPQLFNINKNKAPKEFEYNINKDLRNSERSSFFNLSDEVYKLKNIGRSKIGNSKIEEDGKSVIDNSLSKYFPPISNQGRFGSCVGQSMGYYISSYYYAKENNLDISVGEVSNLVESLVSQPS